MGACNDGARRIEASHRRIDKIADPGQGDLNGPMILSVHRSREAHSLGIRHVGQGELKG